MSNTVIQIKRSSGTATPANGALSAGEQAYSYNSDKLFIGNTAGTGVLEIGGKYWVDTTKVAFDQANAAFSSANSGGGAAAFAQANTAETKRMLPSHKQTLYLVLRTPLKLQLYPHLVPLS